MSTAVALPRPGAATSRLRFVSKELVLWLGLYPVYLAIRGLSIDSFATALANAHHLISVERSLSIFHEASVQDALSAFHGVLSTYYMLGFGPVVAATLVWLAVSRPVLYRGLRNALRWAFPLHPVVMATAVTATGNHYFLDSAAGVAVVLLALVAIRLFNRKER